MIRITLRHLRGSRATEIEVVPLGGHSELILGRATTAAVRFDPRRDPGVGRYHARMAPGQAGEVLVSDLGSRNGTWLNERRVTEPTPVRTGDVLRLGRGGPEMKLSIETFDGAGETLTGDRQLSG